LFEVADEPQWGNVTPFALTSPDVFRPDAPPALDSAAYAASVEEVKSLGSATSTTRTADQTQIAQFWADGKGSYTPAGHWNAIAQNVALDKGNSLSANVRLFAQLNVAFAREIRDPGRHRFTTPSGKIEIYSMALAAKPDSFNLHNYLAQCIQFREMFKVGALESELVTGNNSFLRRPKIDTTPEIEKRFFDEVQKAMTLAEARLKTNPKDTKALYALGVTYGLRGNWNFLVRKAWRDALRDATTGRKLHNRITELDPSNVDATLVQGMHDYVVGSLSTFYRLVGFLAGFLGGPAALANMAIDRWMPHQFAHLSNRLVTQNGVLLMAAAAIAILVITQGRVDKLVVLYSINVFISFVLSFTGLSRHWLRRRIGEPRRPFRIFVAIFGFLLTATILIVTTINKFAEGAWMTVVITGCIIAAGLMIRRHYDACGRLLSQADALFATTTRAVPAAEPPPLRRDKPTAIFLVGGSLGTGMHTLLATRKLFPEHFSNYVFIRVGEVDSDSFRHAGELETLRQRVDEYLAQFVNYCHRRQLAATAYGGAAADATAELTQLLDRALVEFPNSMVFASQLVFKNESFLTRLLHGQTPLIMQRRLQNRGIPMLILPMKL
jgi:hypothetical protein